jgi:hypothetical protein
MSETTKRIFFSRCFITLPYNLIDNNTNTKEIVLQIKNLRNNTENIHRKMLKLALDNLQGKNGSSYEGIARKILSTRERLEMLASRHEATPADMGTPSFRIYLWLRYLSDQINLAQHMRGLQEFMQIIFKEQNSMNLDREDSLVKIDFSGYLYQRKTAHSATQLLVHEGFIDAPQKVKAQLISAAFARRKGKAVDDVRAYATSEPYLERSAAISGEPIANRLSCRGSCYDLAAIFQTLNTQYFGASLPQLRLIWSSARAQRRLGYYHPEIQTIAVNRKLDRAGIPRLLLEYILYHEMLHQHFGIEHRNGRRYAHTSAFHLAEKRFRGRQEAESLIKLLQ